MRWPRSRPTGAWSPPRAVTGFRALPPLVGHSGASGAALFRAADLDLVISGTVNQVTKRSMPYQLMIKAVREVARTV